MVDKKIEEAIFAVGFHMNQCPTCIRYLINGSKGDPPCVEYKRLKVVAKKAANRMD